MIKNKLYKKLAIILTVSLLVSLWPTPLWAEVLGQDPVNLFAIEGKNHREKIISSNADILDMLSTLPDNLPSKLEGLDELKTNDELNDIVKGSSNLESLQLHSPSEDATEIKPLSISRVQSVYSALGAVENTMVVTFTVRNNPPAQARSSPRQKTLPGCGRHPAAPLYFTSYGRILTKNKQRGIMNRKRPFLPYRALAYVRELNKEVLLLL